MLPDVGDALRVSGRVAGRDGAVNVRGSAARGVAHEERVQLGGELLHAAPGLLAQVVRGVGALGEAEAVPEGQRRMIDSCRATRDLAEALPLGTAGRSARPQAADAAEAGEPARVEVLGQEVGDGWVVVEVERLEQASGEERVAHERSGLAASLLGRPVGPLAEDAGEGGKALRPGGQQPRGALRLQQAAEDARPNLLPQPRMAGEQAIDFDPHRERRIRRIPRDVIEAGQRSQAPGGVRAEVLLDSRSERGDRLEPAP